MAFPLARMLLKRGSMSFAAVGSNSPSAYAYCITRTSGYRNCHSEVKPNQLGFTPQAWQAIKDAKEIATDLKQKYVYPESVILALVDQKEGISKDVLKKSSCNLWILKTKLLQIIDKHPKITDVGFWFAAKHRFLLMFGIYTLPFPKELFWKANTIPKCRLSCFLRETEKVKMEMGDDLVGEEHLLITYARDVRFGKNVFRQMCVYGFSLEDAARKIRSELKIKNLGENMEALSSD